MQPTGVSESSPNQPLPSTGPRKLGTTLFILIIILLSLALAFLFYQNYQLKLQLASLTQSQTTIPSQPSPTPDPTAGWKTYINSKIGFQVKYPLLFSQPRLPSGLEDSNFAIGTEDNVHIIIGKSSKDSFGIQVFPFTGTLEELLSTEQAKSIPIYDWIGNITSVTRKNIAVASADAFEITGNYKNSTESPFIAVFTLGKSHGFIINFSQNYNEKEIDQILSTFKFL